MKEDALEKFIESNRKAFDMETPGDHNRRAIERRLFGISLWNNVHVWRAAAVLLLGACVMIWMNPPATEKLNVARNGNQDFSDVERFYAAQISEKSAMISDEGLFADDNFSQDIQKLEAMYNVLAEEMKKHPSDKVKDALVLNMLVRIDLLNQQIAKLEETRKKRVMSL